MSAATSRSASRVPRMPAEYDMLTEEGAALLHEFVHPHPDTAHNLEETLFDVPPEPVEDENAAELRAIEEERAERAQLPWQRRPAAWWFLFLVPFSMIAFMATMAPKLEIFTELICAGQRQHHDPSWDPEDTLGPVPCAKDPRVQAAVAALMTTITTISGVLGCLTTGWWGSLSDRRGRIFVKRLNCLSMIANDVLFIAVFLFPTRVPGGYWALLVGPIIDGLLGGRMASSAAMHAYLADVSAPAARSRIFSQFMGLLFIGMAIGPIVGALISRWTAPIYAFYFATVVHVLYALMIWLAIPESLVPTQMRVHARRHAADVAASKQRRGLGARVARLFGFLAPLAVFLPSADTRSAARRGKGARPRTDYALTLLALSFAPETLILGSYTVTQQFAFSNYGWDAETLGYWISAVGVSRALFLAAVLPAVLRFITARGKPQPIALPHGDEEPLLSAQRERSASKEPAGKRHEKHAPGAELLVARLSLVAAVASGVILVVNPPGWAFVLGTLLSSCASGFHPTMQSLAMELYRARAGAEAETGRLFGALSVLQSLGSAIIGPALYGFVYIRTVRVWPAALFACNIVFVVISLAFLACVRLPDGLGDEPRVLAPDAEEGEEEDEAHAREETLVAEGARGRKGK